MRLKGEVMDRIIKIWILAVLLALAPLANVSAGPPDLQDKQAAADVVEASMDSVPQAVFPQTKFKFDPIFEGTEIKHDFVVENRGEAPLVINKIRPD
jgi:hypothetical protein